MLSMHACDCSCELRGIERLGDVRLVTRLQRGGAIRHRRIRGHGNGWYPPAPLCGSPTQLSNQIVAVFAWHPNVTEHRIRRTPIDFLEGGTGAVDRGHQRTILGKHCPQQITRILLIVDDQNTDIAQQLSRCSRPH